MSTVMAMVLGKDAMGVSRCSTCRPQMTEHNTGSWRIGCARALLL